MALLVSHHEGQLSLTFGTPATALTGATIIGATSLPVTAASGTNFKAGQQVLVGRGSAAEIVTVKSTSANALTLTNGGCANAHASGDEVASVTLSGPGTTPVSPWLSGG